MNLRLLFIALFFSSSFEMKAQDNAKTVEVTLGVLGFSSEAGLPYLVNLSQNDKNGKGHPLYMILGWPKSPSLEINHTYKGTTKEGDQYKLLSITVGGRTIKISDVIPTVAQVLIITLPNGEPGHWEWENGRAVGKAGTKETVNWKKTKHQKDKYANLPACDESWGFANRTLNILITVKPEANKNWVVVHETPVILARRILQYLNENQKNIVFKEANGVSPDFDINVTITENNEGTTRYTASSNFIYYENGTFLSATSGPNSFTSWYDALKALSKDMLGYFENGWKAKTPCLEKNGAVRN